MAMCLPPLMVSHCTTRLPMGPRAAMADMLSEAAQLTVDQFVRNDMVVGLGTGPASRSAIGHIGNKLKHGTLHNIIGVPMSTFSAAEAAKNGIPLSTFEKHPMLDFVFDDADLVQEGTLFAIVGRKGVPGRESVVREKAMLKAASQFAFIIHETQFTQQLYGAVPVIIEQEDWMETAEEIDDLFLGDAEVWRRPVSGVTGPLGGDYPLVTAEGHFVLDLVFTAPISSPVDVAKSLEMSRVVEHGLVIDAVYAAAVASTDSVKIRTSVFRKAFSTS